MIVVGAGGGTMHACAGCGTTLVLSPSPPGPTYPTYTDSAPIVLLHCPSCGLSHVRTGTLEPVAVPTAHAYAIHIRVERELARRLRAYDERLAATQAQLDASRAGGAGER
jgi:hypothetical protein